MKNISIPYQRLNKIFITDDNQDITAVKSNLVVADMDDVPQILVHGEDIPELLEELAKAYRVYLAQI